MDDDLDFTAAEFHEMSNAQRIGLCRRLAERARKLAELSAPKTSRALPSHCRRLGEAGRRNGTAKTTRHLRTRRNGWPNRGISVASWMPWPMRDLSETRAERVARYWKNAEIGRAGGNGPQSRLSDIRFYVLAKCVERPLSILL